MGAVASVCQPSTLRMLIWPEARNAQNSIATYHQCDQAAARGLQAADQQAEGSAIGRHRRLHHIRRTPSAPQVLSLAWALITRLKGTLFHRSGELHCLDKCAACRQILVGQMAKAWGELSARDGRWPDRAFVANDAAIHPLHERYMRGMRLAIESVPAP